MNRYLTTGIVLAGFMFSPTFALAQAATVKVAESAEHGQYLTDADGRALYLFEVDTKGEGGVAATVSCTGECLDRWPPFHSQGEPTGGDMIDAAKLGTIEHDGEMMVTYNGWPLYYFVEDTATGDTKGHDIEEFGGEWYLITPEGEKADDE